MFYSVPQKLSHFRFVSPLQNDLKIRFQTELVKNPLHSSLVEASFLLSRQVVQCETQICRFWSNWANFGRSAPIFQVFCGR